MKWAKNALSSSFYISFRSPYEGIPSPNPPPFFNLLVFSFHRFTFTGNQRIIVNENLFSLHTSFHPDSKSPHTCTKSLYIKDIKYFIPPSIRQSAVQFRKTTMQFLQSVS